jgi:hypothetical protein
MASVRVEYAFRRTKARNLTTEGTENTENYDLLDIKTSVFSVVKFLWTYTALQRRSTFPTRSECARSR